MINAKEAAKIAYDFNFKDIDQEKQLQEIANEIEKESKQGKTVIEVSFMTGENISKLRELGYSVCSIGAEKKIIQW